MEAPIPKKTLKQQFQDEKTVREILHTYNGALKTPMTIPSWTVADVYAAAICVLLGPFALILYYVFTLFSFPLLAFGALYMRCCVQRPTDRLASPSFYLALLVAFPYATLLYALAWVWWGVVFFTANVAGLPFALFRIVFKCELFVILNNIRLLFPYLRMNKQSLSDTARAILGQLDRQGLLEFTFGKSILSMPPQGFATTIIFIPMIKYLWQVNVWIYTLELYHCNQWTPPIEELDEADVFLATRVFVSRIKQECDERREIDGVKFSPHYPWPPSNFRKEEGVVGIQFPEASKMINYTFTRHVVDTKPWSDKAKRGMYIVNLHFFAYHFLTGHVEVNYRTDKGLEHPMWCVVPVKHKLGMMSLGWVNDLFENFVPDIVAFNFSYDADTLRAAKLDAKHEKDTMLGVALATGGVRPEEA